MKRTPKHGDSAQRAFQVVMESVGESEPVHVKDPAAVERGRAGGIARAKSLTSARRKEISKGAVAAKRRSA